jgi:putative transposase
MSRYRLLPTPAQEAVLRSHCAHARYVWNLAVEQHAHWRPGRGQQWDVRRLSRRVGQVWVPKVGWVRFRWSRAVPPGVKSYRVRMDRAGRWHVAFAAIPEPVPAPGNGQAVGIDRALARLRARGTDRRKDWAEKAGTDIARRFDLIRVEDLRIGNMTRSARGTRNDPSRNVRQKAGLNRGILASGWGLLVRRLEDKAPGRVEKINPAFTSQRCSACGRVDPKSRESQAVFQCTDCGYACHADVNAAINIAAGHAVTARGGHGETRPANREPHLLAS